MTVQIKVAECHEDLTLIIQVSLYNIIVCAVGGSLCLLAYHVGYI